MNIYLKAAGLALAVTALVCVYFWLVVLLRGWAGVAVAGMPFVGLIYYACLLSVRESESRKKVTP